MHEGLLRRRGHFQRRHIPAHRARGDRSGQRQQQPANPLRRQSPVLAQPLRDLLPPRVQAAAALRRYAHRRRRLVYGAAHRLDVQLQPPGNFLLRHFLHQMQVADLGPLRHPDHLCVLLAESTRRPCLASSILTRKPVPGGSCRHWTAPRTLLPCAQGVPFHVATGSLFILPLPADDPGNDTWGDMAPIYRGGTGMWIPGSYDHELDLVFWATSQAKPWARASRGTDGAALYSNTTLAIRPTTGEVVWYRQTIPGETHDLDEVYESILVDRGDRQSLFKMGKIGILWELDRRTGEIVGATDLGYQNLVDLDPATGEVTYRPGVIPKLNQPIDQCPSRLGFRNWPAMAFSPETDAFYIPVLMACSTERYVPVEFVPGGGGNGFGGSQPFFHPAANEQLGRLVAMTTSGEVLWERSQRANFSTATLTTAGGLVFVADLDRYIRAYDVAKGEILWQTRVQTSGQGFPMTYEAGGRQFVAVPVGVGSVLPGARYAGMTPEVRRPNAGNALMVFALPE